MMRIVLDYVHNMAAARVEEIKQAHPDVDEEWLYSAILDHIDSGGTADQVSIAPADPSGAR